MSFISFLSSLRDLAQLGFWAARHDRLAGRKWAVSFRPWLDRLEQRLPLSVASSFDADWEGWTVAVNGQAANYASIGGNPGGYVWVTDPPGSGTWYWQAPARFRGNHSAAYGRYLTFDLRQSATAGQFDDDDVVLEGGGRTLVFDTARNPFTDWTSYSVKLDETAGWTRVTGQPATQAEMRMVLAALEGLYIRGEYQSGSATGSLDNVFLGDDAPVLSVGDVTIHEPSSGTKATQFSIFLSAISSQPVTVQVATADGSAAAPGDYIALLPTTLTFAPGEFVKTVSVAVQADSVAEGDEAFFVQLSRATHARIADDQGMGTILATGVGSTFDTNSEGWEVVGDVRPLSYARTGGNPGGHVTATDRVLGNTWGWVAPAKFRGDFSAAYARYLTFDMRQAPVMTQNNGADIVLEGGGIRLVFDTRVNPGTSWTSYSVRLHETAGWRRNALDGPVATAADMRTVLASVNRLYLRGEFRGGPDTGSLDNVFLGNAPPTVAIQDARLTEGNAGNRSAVFTVTLSAVSGQPVLVQLATADGTAVAPGDYAALPPIPLIFAPGETQKTFTVLVRGDTAVEPDETFVVLLQGATNATLADALAVGTILNDDENQGSSTRPIDPFPSDRKELPPADDRAPVLAELLTAEDILVAVRPAGAEIRATVGTMGRSVWLPAWENGDAARLPRSDGTSFSAASLLATGSASPGPDLIDTLFARQARHGHKDALLGVPANGDTEDLFTCEFDGLWD